MHHPTSTEMWVFVAETGGVSVLATLLLYLSIRRASVPRLKTVLPWVTRSLWGMWALIVIVTLRDMLADKRSFLTLGGWILYFPLMNASSWIKSRLQFADPPNWNARRMSWLLHIPGPTYVEIKNPSASAAWYVEKLGLRRLAPSEDADRRTIRLTFSVDGEEMRLGPHDPLSLGGTVMLYSRRLKRAREVLRGRGIDIGTIQLDRQGTSYFEFRDLEGNTIEVCTPNDGVLSFTDPL